MRRPSPVLALAFLALVVAGLLVYGKLSGENVQQSLATLDWRVLPLALGLHICAHLFWAARYALLAPACQQSLGWPRAWLLLTAGVFGGAVTPGRIGGEALKLSLLVRQGVPAVPASRLLLLDRSIDLLFFLATGTVAAVVLPSLYGVAGVDARLWAAAGTATLGVFVMLLAATLWRPAWVVALVRGTHRIRARLRRTALPEDPKARVHAFTAELRAGVVSSFTHHPVRITGAFLLTAGNWIAEYAVLWVLLQGFGITAPFWSVFLVGTVMTLVSNIPLTPGGSGVAELAAIALLGTLVGGFTILFPVAWRAVTYLYDLSAGSIATAWHLAQPARRPLAS